MEGMTAVGIVYLDTLMAQYAERKSFDPRLQAQLHRARAQYMITSSFPPLGCFSMQSDGPPCIFVVIIA